MSGFKFPGMMVFSCAEEILRKLKVLVCIGVHRQVDSSKVHSPFGWQGPFESTKMSSESKKAVLVFILVYTSSGSELLTNRDVSIVTRSNYAFEHNLCVKEKNIICKRIG